MTIGQCDTLVLPAVSYVLSGHHCADLILGPGGDAVLLGDQLHDLGLVEEHGLVQRRRAEL